MMQNLKVILRPAYVEMLSIALRGKPMSAFYCLLQSLLFYLSNCEDTV